MSYAKGQQGKVNMPTPVNKKNDPYAENRLVCQNCSQNIKRANQLKWVDMSKYVLKLIWENGPNGQAPKRVQRLNPKPQIH